VTGRSAARRRASVPRSSAEKDSSMREMSGLRTGAQAIPRRCRWPPETFVPPVGDGALEAAEHGR
jgi:hypothetical protein